MTSSTNRNSPPPEEERCCILCIGSNCHPEANLPLARRRLQTLFPGIRFAAERETEPLFFANPARFVNQVATFQTNRPKATVGSQLKAIECEAGRQPGDKLQEQVCLDIDLLTYGNELLKPADWQREYVVCGLNELLTVRDKI